jgi:hypothetical protein
LVFADTVILKNGKTIEGMITERGTSYIKIDFSGTELKIYNDEIKEIIKSEKDPIIANDKFNNLQKTVLIDKVFGLYHIKKQLAQISSRISEEYAQHKTRIDEQAYKTAAGVISDSYKEDKLYITVKKYFENNYNYKYLNEVKDFLNSPFSERVFTLEEKSDEGSIKELKKFGKSLEVNPPPEARIALIKQLDTAVGATNLQIESMVAMYKGIARAVDPLVSPDKRLMPGELEKVSEAMRKELKDILKNVVSVSFLYTYQSLSDEELKRYIQFWTSDAGKWFNGTYSEAVAAAMKEASDDAIFQIAKLADTGKIE